MTLLLDGIGISRGIALGRLHKLQAGQPPVAAYCVPDSELETEIQRLRSALNEAARQLEGLRARIPQGMPPDVEAFIDAHLLILEDKLLAEGPMQLIRHQRCNAEWALKQQRDEILAVFESMDDGYLRTRRDDIDQIIFRVLQILQQQDGAGPDDEPPLAGHLVLADDLAPTDIVILHTDGVRGFITESGGPLSHAAIIARSLGVPAVAGLHSARQYLSEGEEVIVDGQAGMVVAGAGPELRHHLLKRQASLEAQRRRLNRLRDRPARTRDGVDIVLHANIELADDLRGLDEAGATGVGLYRTEFLYMDRAGAASEAEQLAAYERVIQRLCGRPLTIRTVDLGADKGEDQSGASNPALSLRAVRRCLQYPAMFKSQLRAILRASALGTVRLMFPMVTSLGELDQALRLLEQSRTELTREGHAWDPSMAVGAMIEVPAAAVAADLFARRLDFLSIGTNDLIQYTLAIDRTDDSVNHLYDPLHPAVLRLVRGILEAGTQSSIPVSMCGEMAGDPRYTRLLLGLGLREFSAQPASLLEIKRVITQSDAARLAAPAMQLLQGADSGDVQGALKELHLRPERSQPLL